MPMTLVNMKETGIESLRQFRKMIRPAALLLFLFIAQGMSRATVFTWPTGGANPTWSSPPAAGTSETQDYFPATGQGISVSVANVGQTWQSTGLGGNANYPLVETPATQNSYGDPSGNANTNGLILYVSNTSNVVTNYIKVTINFNYTGGANNITFNLWDVDYAAGTFRDTISNIVGISAANGATLQATTITPSSTNQVVGTVGTAGVYVQGTNGNNNNSQNGNVTIGFSQAVTSISFQWSNGLAGGTTQAIGIGQITFTGVGTAFPEVGSATGALALCGGLLGVGRFRRRRHAGAVAGA